MTLCPLLLACLQSCLIAILLDKPQKLQNRAARIVTNSSFDTSSLPLIGSLGWLTIKEMIVFETATAVNKSLHGLAPEYMQLIFRKLSENCSRSFRNTDTDLKIPRFATSYGQRSFSYRGVNVWNKLSTEIKNASLQAILKNLLKQSIQFAIGIENCRVILFFIAFIVIKKTLLGVLA